jgi:hypothetical protein
MTVKATERKVFKIVDSQDGHTKTFQVGVFFDGNSQEFCHIIQRNGKHKTFTIEQARRIWAAIVKSNKETTASK